MCFIAHQYRYLVETEMEYTNAKILSITVMFLVTSHADTKQPLLFDRFYTKKPRMTPDRGDIFLFLS